MRKTDSAFYKAMELVESFKKHSYYNGADNTANQLEINKENAKECALIAVSEIIKTIKKDDGILISEEELTIHTKSFWVSVEREIWSL